MSTWEQHKEAAAVAGAFLVLLLLLWVAFLRGNAQAVTDHASAFEGNKNVRERLFPESGTRVSTLQSLLEDANRLQQERIDALIKQLHYPFEDAIIPPKELPVRQVYVRNRRDTLRQYLLQEIEGKNRFKLGEEVETLGLVLPSETTEDRATDEKWLKQIVAMRRAVDLLLSVHEEPDGTHNILALQSIQPLDPVRAEAPADFVLAFPVELEVDMRLNGVRRLLEQTDRDGDWQIVQSLQILAGPERQSRQLSNKPQAERQKKEEFQTWYGHYYRVRIVLATLQLSDTAEAQDAPKKGNSAPAVVVPH